MKKQRAGSIINLTTSLVIELASDNIRLNAVAPGIIKTPIQGRTQEQFEELNGMQPLGRVGERVEITLSPGDLQFMDAIGGVWKDVDGATNPYQVELASPQKFYRVISQ